MTTRLNPSLGLRDTTREAMEFYRSVFGGELTMSTFAEFQAGDDPALRGDSFGMCVDKFGVNWLVNIAGAPA
jgi:uncharacterized glyoxalase superfamily protein PhnB